MDTIKTLSDWLVLYLRNRDIMFKKIVSIEEKSNKVVVKYKDKEACFVIQEMLGIPSSDCIVCLNTKENLEFLIKNWEKFSSNKQLCIYFVNPFSKSEKRWILYPATHATIAEAESLKLGLYTMFETVDEFQ